MLINLTHFAAEDATSGIGALGVDGKAFLVQLITFALAFLILKKYAFGPILSLLDKRRTIIEDGVALGEQMKLEKAKLDETVDETLANARSQADGIIADAQDSGKQVVRDAEIKASDKAAGILREAEGRIATEKARARKELEKEVVNLISDATEAIIGEKVDAKKDAQLIDTALKGAKA